MGVARIDGWGLCVYGESEKLGCLIPKANPAIDPKRSDQQAALQASLRPSCPLPCLAWTAIPHNPSPPAAYFAALLCTNLWHPPLPLARPLPLPLSLIPAAAAVDRASCVLYTGHGDGSITAAPYAQPAAAAPPASFACTNAIITAMAVEGPGRLWVGDDTGGRVGTVCGHGVWARYVGTVNGHGMWVDEWWVGGWVGEWVGGWVGGWGATAHRGLEIGNWTLGMAGCNGVD